MKTLDATTVEITVNFARKPLPGGREEPAIPQPIPANIAECLTGEPGVNLEPHDLFYPVICMVKKDKAKQFISLIKDWGIYLDETEREHYVNV